LIEHKSGNRHHLPRMRGRAGRGVAENGFPSGSPFGGYARRQPLSVGGRWSLLDPAERSGVVSADVSSMNAAPATAAAETDPALVERLAWQLLRRYGVVFRDLLAREAGLPPWREILWVYRRLEARGEVRGGRFVSGFQGEQFAVPGAVESLRAVRREAKPGQRVEVAAADPLNLVGILTPDARVPAVLGNRVRYLDGVPDLPRTELGDDLPPARSHV
jgi:ATP-dependent helicase Lhr and Lhr-like helicase